MTKICKIMLSRSGQIRITIPQEIVKAAKLENIEYVQVTIENGKAVVTPVKIVI